MATEQQQFKDILNPPQQSMGFTEAAQEGLSVAFKGLIEGLGQVWDGAKPAFDHGRTEAAAALFSGHGHVMYMKGQEGIEQGQDQAPDHGLPPIEAVKQPETLQQERGGIEI
jgi:hypothetical protein